MFYLMVANSFDIPKQWSSGLGEKHYQYDADGGLAARPCIRTLSLKYTSQLVLQRCIYMHLS